MATRQHFSKQLLALAISLFLPVIAAPGCSAQYSPFGYGYSPLTGSSNWLWLSRSLFNPTSMLGRGAYGYNAPYYLANSLAWNAAYATSQGISGANRKAAANKFYANQNNNGINAPVVDQINVAPWYYPPRGSAGNPALSSAAALNNKDPFADPSFMPVPTQIPDGSPSPTADSSPLTPAASTNANEAPGPAPDFRGSKSNSLPDTAPPSGKSSKSDKHKSKSKSKGVSSNPFAQAFVDHVNDNFSGDISKALSDKETRGYAQAIGLLDNSKSRDFDLPTDRIDLIRRILQDPDEDSLTKVNTIRVLIKH
ncbi:MAG: hypothetical protein K2X81_14990 [Candidatus Obscuribacterales bacterium]|nr:hypothetical protein [Candidatus Obscuribacterales bacterium]